ncbi:MAG: PilW family protein [Thermoanaerobaculales bacterium]|nr:PilW family protein [Thermoanaerobaculales bacterium]
MRRNLRRQTRAHGFSLVEALVALLLLVGVLASFLVGLNRLQRTVTIQADLASAAEDLRHTAGSITRMLRMVGCGGLPLAVPDTVGNLRPLAVDVVDNVAAVNGFVSSLSGESWRFTSGRRAAPGTDVLRIRGVMTSPSYDIAAGDFISPGRVLVSETSPWTGDSQTLSPPSSTADRPFLFALRSPLDLVAAHGGRRSYGQYRVVRVEGDVEVLNGPAGRVMQVGYDDSPAGVYAFLNPADRLELDRQDVVSGGFLDDLVFFVATNNYEKPSLYRLRVKRPGGRVRAEEMVPNVCNLQVAFGCDVNGDGEVGPSEWFLSAQNPQSPPVGALATLVQLRLSLVSRTQSPDRGWVAHPAPLENAPDLAPGEPHYRYRTTTVRINVRSHPAVR